MELIRHAREEHRWGAQRTRVWLQRVHNIAANARFIQHIFRELGLPRLTKTSRRKPKQLRLFEKDERSDSVQVDVKVVKLTREKVFQYTALDDCSRMRVLRLYPRQNHRASLHFFDQVRQALQHHYNHGRFSLALGGRTPAEKLSAHVLRLGSELHVSSESHQPFVPAVSEHAPAPAEGRAERGVKVDVSFGVHS